MKSALKSVAQIMAVIVVLPAIIGFFLRSVVQGRDLALHSSSQWLSLVPGISGVYLRNAFLRFALDECHPTARVEFGTLFSKAGAVLGPHCYVGPYCHLGLVTIEQDVLIAAGVHIPSGSQTHGTAELDIPIREQPGKTTRVRIGAGSWIGAASIVMADVGKQSVVGAGSVVTRPIPDRVVAAGSPARVLRSRESDEPHDSQAADGVVKETIHFIQRRYGTHVQ